jgi:hypothetical protein
MPNLLWRCHDKISNVDSRKNRDIFCLLCLATNRGGLLHTISAVLVAVLVDAG